MENKSIQEENLGVLVKWVDYHIKGLVKTADNYTQDLKKSSASFEEAVRSFLPKARHGKMKRCGRQNKKLDLKTK